LAIIGAGLFTGQTPFLLSNQHHQRRASGTISHITFITFTATQNDSFSHVMWCLQSEQRLTIRQLRLKLRNMMFLPGSWETNLQRATDACSGCMQLVSTGSTSGMTNWLSSSWLRVCRQSTMSGEAQPLYTGICKWQHINNG